MIKNLVLFCSLLLITPFVFGQGTLADKISKADSMYFDYKDYNKALELYKAIKVELDKKHPDFGYTVDKIARSLFNLELLSRETFDKENSIKYSNQFIELAEDYPSFINEDVLAKKYYMYKNLVVANFEKENFEEVKKYKSLLYKAYKKGELPEGLAEYYNFDYFKFEDKNIWGYEWYADLPKDRFSSSFTKVVYYVYNTNPDGSDKDQLYRLHVLMFHGDGEKFDYVLDKRLVTATEEVSGTLYSYTYDENIDYEKLKNDVKEILKGNLQPDTKRTKTKDKDGKVKIDVKMKN